MNQLLTAKDYNTAGTLVKEYTYTYDTYGNIRTSSNGTTTHTYTYGDAEWLDLLTAYDGVTIAYDSIGNPTNYYNGTSWTFTWRNGRELNTATSGSTSLSFAYDQNRVRTAKTAGNVTHKYYYAGGKLLRETWTQAGTTYVLDFLYDQNGRPYALKYTAGAAAAVTYYYVLNLQGDVIRLVDSTGATVASYDYDPWGKLLSVTDAGGNAITSTTHIANINPLRYRGYYYDSETGFYYLQSRYYDPNIGRFINADSYASTGQGYLGYNMFAYCGNNPVMGYDPEGEFTWFTALVGAVVGAAVGVVSALVTGGDVKDVVISALSSAAAGAIIGATGSLEAGAAVGRVVGSAICAAGSYIDARVNGADCGTAAACAGITFGVCLYTSSITGSLGVGQVAASALVDSTIGLGGSLCYTALSTGLTNKNVASKKAQVAATVSSTTGGTTGKTTQRNRAVRTFVRSVPPKCCIRMETY